MNDSDVGYDMEWNNWMDRPDLTNQKGWVTIKKDGSVKEFEHWREAVDTAMDNKGGTLMSKEFYETQYKEIQNGKH